MAVFVTGVAGFIGYHVAEALIKEGKKVIGVDNLNDYYDVSLKEERLRRFLDHSRATFIEADIADKDLMLGIAAENSDITEVVHLAAQAGVRYSLINPYAYTQTNIAGFLVFLEFCRNLRDLRHAIYASSSSVYGANTKLPYSVTDRVDTPISLYAATKRSAELMAYSYSHLYSIPLTGLRFFTVYGPWGRPDMSPFIFIQKILAEKPIPVFNNGNMSRDFTYIDDIVEGILRCLDHPPKTNGEIVLPCVYNIGNNSPEPLMRFISLIEQALGKKAEIKFLPMQAGDVKETFADIEATTRDFGFTPKTTLDEGIPKLVKWYQDFYENT